MVAEFPVAAIFLKAFQNSSGQTMTHSSFLKICSILIFLCTFPLGLRQVSFAQEVQRILSIESYDMLNTVPDTYLIDVRTRGEYQFVGHPFKAYLFPYMFMAEDLEKEDESYGYRLFKNKAFIEEISKVFKKTDNLLILCRDGIRSTQAAKDLVAAGFTKVFNVVDGFEGPDFPTFEDSNRNKYYRQLAKRHKLPGYRLRRHYGWQWWGLPWTYEIDPKLIYPPDLVKPKK